MSRYYACPSMGKCCLGTWGRGEVFVLFLFSQNSVSPKLIILTVIRARCSAGVSRCSRVAEASTAFHSIASGVLWI